MTPAARVQACIDILDDWSTGLPVEKVLTNWGRSHRFAGSKDRAAIRDLTFACLRKRGLVDHLDNPTSRVWVAAVLNADDQADLGAIFSGAKFAPQGMSDSELGLIQSCISPILPTWLTGALINAFGDQADDVIATYFERGPISIRTNKAKTSKAKLKTLLTASGFVVDENPLSDTALTVSGNTRKLTQSDEFQNGLFEVQDAAAQQVCDLIGAQGTVLDYCAGGGGKSLALANNPSVSQVVASDLHAQRLAQIEPRLKRSGAQVRVIPQHKLAQDNKYDFVICDVPCSGSGTWRRAPENIWRFDPDQIAPLVEQQLSIVQNAIRFLKPNGTLVYITCSVFEQENTQATAEIARANPQLTLSFEKQLCPTKLGDGFYIAQFQSHA